MATGKQLSEINSLLDAHLNFSATCHPWGFSSVCVFCFKLLYFLFSFKVQLIYNVVLLTAIQQRDSVIYLVFIFFFPLWFLIGYWIQFFVPDSRTLLFIHSVLKVCCCFSISKSCPTLCSSMDCSTPAFPVLHHFLEFAQIHVCWVGDAIQLSHPLSPPSPLALNLPQQ